MSAIGGLILAIVIGCASAPYLVAAGRRIERRAPQPVARRATQARQAGTRAARQGRKVTAQAVQVTVPRIVASAVVTDWRAAREHRRTARAQPAAAAPAAAATPAARPAPKRRTMPPPPAAPASAQPERTTPMAAPANGSAGVGAAGDLFAAISVIIGHARSGGVRAKFRAVTTLAEAMDLMGSQIDSWVAQLAEPDQHYSPAVWEPVGQGAAHLHAASARLAESASSLNVLLNTSVGELGGTVRAPHHDELNADS